MRKIFYIWNGKAYSKVALTKEELTEQIVFTHERPILNAQGEMLTTDDLDY